MKKSMRLSVQAGTVTYYPGGEPVRDTDPIDPLRPIQLGTNTRAGIRIEQGKPVFVEMSRGGASSKAKVKTKHPLAKRGCIGVALRKDKATKVVKLTVAKNLRRNEYEVQIKM